MLATLKRFLKYGLLLLTIVGYLTSIMEFDEEECKQNYNKETHIYNNSKPFAHQFSHQAIAVALPVYVLSSWLVKHFLPQTNLRHFAAEPDPPARLYLRYSIFLI